MKKIFFFFVVSVFIFCSPKNFLPKQYSGGETTQWDSSSNAFDLPAANLEGEKLIQWARGNAIFNIRWVAPGNSAVNGLGPIFNNVSCRSCHVRDGRGRPPLSPNKMMSEMLVRVSLPNQVDSITGGVVGLKNYGDQLNERGIQLVDKKIQGEVQITVNYEKITQKFPDGEIYILHKPIYTFKNWNYGNPGIPGKDFLFSPRVAQHLSGMGLLQAIPEKTIEEFSDPNDRDKDGISGRMNMVWDKQSKSQKFGRFGWKANQPNLKQQSLAAFIGDVGITSSLFPDENCTSVQTECSKIPSGDNKNPSGNEISKEQEENLEVYISLLNVPGRRNWKNPVVLKGKDLFDSIGCVKCHIDEMKTGKLDIDTKHKELAEQTIRPYTDLLLHDMGDELADHRPDFKATGREWRTPPLWGIGLFKQVNQHIRLLHDGRARGYQEAILWHGGEAKKSKEKYKHLSPSDRKALIEFLKSL